jgi:preprotein translocase subunit Sec61beta
MIVTLTEFVLGVVIAVVIIVTAVNILLPGGAP